MCSELPLGLSTDFPLQRWLRDAEARVSGYVLLAGNASAHEHALECQLRATARDRPELLQIASRSAWHRLSCADGCPSLADDVARLMRERTGRWSVVLVQAAVGLGLGLGLGLGRGLGHAAKHRLRRHRARDASRTLPLRGACCLSRQPSARSRKSEGAYPASPPAAKRMTMRINRGHAWRTLVERTSNNNQAAAIDACGPALPGRGVRNGGCTRRREATWNFSEPPLEVAFWLTPVSQTRIKTKLRC